MFPHQVEAEQLLKQAVPELRVVHLVFQTQVSHQLHSLERQRVPPFHVCIQSLHAICSLYDKNVLFKGFPLGVPVAHDCGSSIDL